MLNYQFRTLDNWQGERVRQRRSSIFRAQWIDTLDLLEAELKHLRATEIVIQADVSTDMLKNDGMLRANASPSTPRVCLSFQSKHGPLSYPCDDFMGWQDNVRAIALALQALRAVDRYGVTRRAEQYKGWQALAGPPPVDKWALIQELTRLAGDAAHGQLEKQVKLARVRCHPDRHGGDETLARRVNQIAQLLGVK